MLEEEGIVVVVRGFQGLKRGGGGSREDGWVGGGLEMWLVIEMYGTARSSSRGVVALVVFKSLGLKVPCQKSISQTHH